MEKLIILDKDKFINLINNNDLKLIGVVNDSSLLESDGLFLLYRDIDLMNEEILIHVNRMTASIYGSIKLSNLFLKRIINRIFKSFINEHSITSNRERVYEEALHMFRKSYSNITSDIKEDAEKLIKSNYPVLSCSLKLNDIYYSKIIGRSILDLAKSSCMYSKVMYAIPNILPSEDSDVKVGGINLLLMNVGGEYPIIFTECNEGSLVPSEEDLILGLILLKRTKEQFHL